MKDIFNPVYREDYLKGYATGLDPFVFASLKRNNKAFNFGFLSGRQEYESMNGRIVDGIPERIVTKKHWKIFFLLDCWG